MDEVSTGRPLAPPKTFKIYTVLKQFGLNFTIVGGAINPQPYLGHGFYASREEAEYQRTIEILKDDKNSKFYVYELEVDNPAI